jgi:hypothetical protein
MNDREQFEAWYVENVFDLQSDPVGSRLCGLQWKAWQAARATPAQPVGDLHNAIMNLPCKQPNPNLSSSAEKMRYKEGHRDARHAAAELVAAHKAERHQPSPSSVGAAIRALPLPEPLEIYWPQLNSNALGCGVEDRNIRDRYDAAEYGWQDAMERAIECVPEYIYTAEQVRELLSEAAALAEQVQGQQVPNLQRITDAIVSMREFYLGMLASSLRNDRADAFDKARHKDITKMVQEIVISELAAAPSIAQDGQKSEGA